MILVINKLMYNKKYMSSKKLLFLDTETTGNEDKDCLCQIAYGIVTLPEIDLPEDKIVNKLYKPPLPISIESMAVHHITNKMVADMPEFKLSEERSQLERELADPNTIFIAHNAKFDINMLEKEGLKVPQHICTLRLARHVDKENKIPRYNLQYLRYYLGMEVNVPAHDAKGDVVVLSQLFARLYKKMLEENDNDPEKTVNTMLEISSRPSLLSAFNFGKHNGKSIAEVCKVAPDYLNWLLNQKLENNPDDEDWIYTLKHYLGKLQ